MSYQALFVSLVIAPAGVGALANAAYACLRWNGSWREFGSTFGVVFLIGSTAGLLLGVVALAFCCIPMMFAPPPIVALAAAAIGSSAPPMWIARELGRGVRPWP